VTQERSAAIGCGELPHAVHTLTMQWAAPHRPALHPCNSNEEIMLTDLHDTTEQEALRRAVNQARVIRVAVGDLRQAELAADAKSLLLTTISHELRTPLNSIAAYVELLRMSLPEMTANQRRFLARIEASQNHMLSLINDVLDFAMHKSGQVPYDITNVSVLRVLKEVEGLEMPQIEHAKLSFACAGCPEWLLVRADAVRFRQILLNLLSNAIKFTEPGGTVSVTCEWDEDRAFITMRDTGRGIPPDEVAAIFEPFVRLRTAGVQQPGTGLGLAISRAYARAMGGDLWAEKQTGGGSTFTLELPRSAGSGGILGPETS
jgi:signal transduction histidine kinase